MHETGRLKWTLSIRQFRSEARPTSHRPIHFDLGDNSKQCQSLFTTGGRRAPGTPPPRDTLPTFLASKPFQIMRHSVHACHEFNFRLQPSRNEFPTSPPTRRTRSPVSLIADEATKKRARSLSLCDGNDFPATVASRRPKSNARRGCQRRANSVVGFISHTFCCLYLLSSSPAPPLSLFPQIQSRRPHYSAVRTSVSHGLRQPDGRPACRPAQ